MITGYQINWDVQNIIFSGAKYYIWGVPSSILVNFSPCHVDIYHLRLHITLNWHDVYFNI